MLVEREVNRCVVCLCRALPAWVAQTELLFDGDLASMAPDDFRESLARALREVPGVSPRVLLDIALRSGSIVATVQSTSVVALAAIEEYAASQALAVEAGGVEHTLLGVVNDKASSTAAPPDASTSEGGLSSGATVAIGVVAVLAAVAALAVVAVVQYRRWHEGRGENMARRRTPAPLKRPRRRITPADIRHYVSSVDQANGEAGEDGPPAIPIYNVLHDAEFAELGDLSNLKKAGSLQSLVVEHVRPGPQPRQAWYSTPSPLFSDITTMSSPPDAAHPFAATVRDSLAVPLRYETNAQVPCSPDPPSGREDEDELSSIDLAMFKHTSRLSVPAANAAGMPAALRVPSINFEEYYGQVNDTATLAGNESQQRWSKASQNWVLDETGSAYSLTHDYRPARPGEGMLCQAHDIVYVTEKHASGWWYVLNARTQTFGYVPNTFLQPVEPTTRTSTLVAHAAN